MDPPGPRPNEYGDDTVTDTSTPRADDSPDEETEAITEQRGAGLDSAEADEIEEIEEIDDDGDEEDDAEDDEEAGTPAAPKRSGREGPVPRRARSRPTTSRACSTSSTTTATSTSWCRRPAGRRGRRRPLKALVGPRGATLEALQELSRLAIFRQTGYARAGCCWTSAASGPTRRKELGAVAKNAAEKVKEHGEPVRLEPMSAFERKCVHDVINAMSGVQSESEGVEPNRRIIVRPAD